MKNALFISMLAALFLAACAPDQSSDEPTDDELLSAELAVETRYEISPPMEKLNVPMQAFEVDLRKEKTLSLENGTEIHIPQGSIVDENGAEVTGEIDLTYREFHDVADVLMSGIPMSYDSAGSTHIFQTAGMMEIRASQNGKPVYIADGKPVEVRMASFIEGDGYNLYAYDESAGQWQFQDVSNFENMPVTDSGLEISEEKILAQLPPAPYKPQLLSPEAIPFDFDVDYSNYPMLAPYKDIIWQLSDLQEDKKVDWVFGEIWASVNIEEYGRKKGVYSLSLRNQNKRADILVTPAVEEENYEAAMAVYQDMMRRQEALKARLRSEAQTRQTRMQRQALIYRAFSVSGFGIYNCDRIYSMQTQNMVAANFEVEDYDGSIDQVYLIMPGENAVITYTKWSWKNFRYSPSTDNKIVAVLPGNVIATFDEADFRKYKPSGNFTFKLRKTDKIIETGSDLRSAIGV